ncbi:MAG: heavy metal-binding domain-containing protein [Cellvibrionales bacterium]|nr:heavy metal-binding domain-containing protein [Cellvibrionales bacterium]
MSHLSLIVFLTLIAGLHAGFGQHAERKHFHSFWNEERNSKTLLCFSERRIPEQKCLSRDNSCPAALSFPSDYFKQFVAGLPNLFGGRVTIHESLLERARRGAILRMEGTGTRPGADSVWNVRRQRLFPGSTTAAAGWLDGVAWHSADPRHLTLCPMNGYENPDIPEGINVTQEHPLKEFGQLVIGVTALIIILALAFSGLGLTPRHLTASRSCPGSLNAASHVDRNCGRTR